jgi:CRP-like cAMP-binding protein
LISLVLLGAVDISEAEGIVCSHMEDEEVPSEYPINIMTPSRVWILYAENKLSQEEWVGRFRNVISGAYDTIAYANLSNSSRSELLSDVEKPPSPMMRSNSTELQLLQPNKSRAVSANWSPRARKSSIFHRSPHLDSAASSPVSKGDITEQSRRLASLKLNSSYSSYITGNLPMFSLSYFTQINVDEMEAYQLLKGFCSDSLSSSSSSSSTLQHELQKRIFDCAIFDLSPKEGEILIQEGSRFDWIYFVLKGEVSRRKGWGGEMMKVIAEPILTGQCIGDVECVLLDSISPFTLIVGPATSFLKIRKEIFLRECSIRTNTGSRHQSIDQKKDPTREGLFSSKYLLSLSARDAPSGTGSSSSSSSSSNAFEMRYKFFSSQCISCHNLFEKQSKSNIIEISKLFNPILMRAGEVIIDLPPSDHQEEEEDQEGTTITPTSPVSFEFFLLIDGTCSVFKRDILGIEQCVHSIRSGEWIGETGFFKERKNETKVTATVDCILLQTDANGFQRFLDLGGPNVRHCVERSVTNHMASTIKSIPLFHDLEDHLIENICVIMSFKEFSTGTLLIQHGQTLNSFYLILHGRVDGSLDKSGDLEFSNPHPVIDTIQENDFFGEGWILLSNYLSEATYHISSSSTKVVALTASIQDFKILVDTSSVLRLRLEERFQSRKSRLEMTHALTSVIAQSLLGRMSPINNYQPKLSMDSFTEFESMNSEILFLRAEVERLGGAKYQRPLGKKALRQIEESKIPTSGGAPNTSPVLNRRQSLKQLFSPRERERSKSPSRSVSDRTLETPKIGGLTLDVQGTNTSPSISEKRRYRLDDSSLSLTTLLLLQIDSF